MKMIEKEKKDTSIANKDFDSIMKALFAVPHSKTKPKQKVAKKK